jgi:hypothetical protein
VTTVPLTAAEAEALTHAESALRLRADRLRHDAATVGSDARELLEGAATQCERSAHVIATLLRGHAPDET